MHVENRESGPKVKSIALDVLVRVEVVDGSHMFSDEVSLAWHQKPTLHEIGPSSNLDIHIFL